MKNYDQQGYLLTTFLPQQKGPPLEAPQGPLDTWGKEKWLRVFHVPTREQNLLSPLAAATTAQESFFETMWSVTGATPREESALWYERQQNIEIAAMRGEIRSVSQQLAELKQEILRLQSLRAYVVPLTTLSAEFQLSQPIPVTIEGDDDSFTATFAEANISASGETEADAIANFKDSMVSSYQVLEAMPADQLGPLPERQWKVLQNVVHRAEE